MLSATRKPALSISGYLTEDKLALVLNTWVADNGGTSLRQAKLAGTRMSYDFLVECAGRCWYVEFEGDSHFRDANVIYRDSIKELAANEKSIPVVRIPYFVQLNSETFSFFFGTDFPRALVSDFPHGFHTTKMLPSSFCRGGAAKYERLLSALPASVSAEIYASLAKKMLDTGLPAEYVFHR